LCKFVEYFHVFPTSYLRRRKGPAVPESAFSHGSHEVLLSWGATGKDAKKLITGTRRREHRVYWVPSSVCWFPICDGRNCELLNSMMTQICSRNRNRPSSKKQNVFGRTKPPKQKGVNLEGHGGWSWILGAHTCGYVRMSVYVSVCVCGM